MNEENLEKLEKFFVEIYNNPICFFCFKDTMRDDYKSKWDKYVSEPSYLDFSYQKLKSGSYEDPEEVRTDFLAFVENCREFIALMDLKDTIFESCFLEFQETYWKKLNKALMSEDEKILYKCEHDINLIQNEYKRMMDFIDVNDLNDNCCDHFIPKKIDPI